MRRIVIALACVAVGATAATATAGAASPRGLELAATGWHRPPHRAKPAFHIGLIMGANQGTPLDVTDVRGMAVDDADGYVFISGGKPSAYHVEVLTTDGTRIAAPGLANEAHPYGMAFADGKLYVNRCPDHVIDVIDPATLTVTDSFGITPSTDGQFTTCDVTVAGGRIWFQSGGDGPLASAPVAAPHTMTTYPSLGNFYHLALGWNPAAPDVLVATGRIGDADAHGTMALDISTATPTVTSEGYSAGTGAAVSPDGATTFLAGGKGLASYATADFSSNPTYDSDGYSNDPVISHDGGYVAFSSDRQYDPKGGQDVYVYPVGSSTPQRTWRLPDGAYSPLKMRVAFSADDSKLYVVSYGALGRFHALLGPTKQQTSMTSSLGSSLIRAGGRTTFTVHLDNWSTNRRVHIYSESWDSVTPKLIDSPLVDSATGDATIDVAPVKAHTYWATWDGDAVYGGSIGTPVRMLRVRFLLKAKLLYAYRIRDGVHLYHSGTAPVYVVAAYPRVRSSCALDFQLEVRTSSGWKYTDACGAENRHGIGAAKITHLRTHRLYRINAVARSNVNVETQTRWVQFEVTG